MWTSDRRTDGRQEEAAADLGQVTLGGDPAGVYLGGERRWLPVYSPGGYQWRPSAGDRVLVIKGGGGRDTPCVTGTRQSPGTLEPGEVRISGGTGMVRLNQRGVSLTGQVRVNGKTLEELIRTVVESTIGAEEA